MPTQTLETIDLDALSNVAGGARVTARSGSDDQLQLMLTQITSSIQSLSANKNQNDPTQLLLMMMMMGGFGGGGGGGGVVAAPAAAPAAPVINVDTSVIGGRRGGCFTGGGGSKKGW